MHSSGPLSLSGLNHISRVCQDIVKAVDFYEHVLNFVPIRRPSSFEFGGAWLFNPTLGVGFHLIQSDAPGSRAEPREINPRSDHLSFQSDNLADVTHKLQVMGIPFVQESVVEGGIHVMQVFFHDPDQNMIEICNCDCLPIQPLARQSSQDSAYCSIPSEYDLKSAPQMPHAQRMQSSTSSIAGRAERPAKFVRAVSPDSPLPLHA